MKLLMCKPDFYDVTYDINPWMPPNIKKVDKELAMDQWTKLYNALREHISVRLIQQHPDCPDMVFTANAGLVRYNKIALSLFRTSERSLEEPIWEKWFLDNSYVILKQTSFPFEGAGDFLKCKYGNNFFGYGFRSNINSGEFLNVMEPHLYWYPMKLTDPHFYHLDTCFCPLDEETVLCYPHAIDTEDLIRATKGMRIVNVVESEAKQFACNAVVYGKHIFMPQCQSVAYTLDKMGYEVHQFDMSEFIKAGGACKCLTLEIL